MYYLICACHLTFAYWFPNLPRMQSSAFLTFVPQIFFYVLLVHSQCSKTCGRGLRKRSVFCRSTDPGAKAVVVPDSMCRQHHKPKPQETCVLRRCPKNERLQWMPTPWGEVGKGRHEARGAVATEVKCVVFSLKLLRKIHPEALEICYKKQLLMMHLALWVHFVARCVCLTPSIWEITSHRNISSTAMTCSFMKHQE